MRNRVTIVLSVLVLQGWTQLDVPVRVELNGTEAALARGRCCYSR